MFDQLRIKQPMPDGYQSDDWYQTKSMECELIDYEVDKDGQLWELDFQGKYTVRDKKALSYTGGIHFYQKGRYYDAIFDIGKLVVIRLHPQNKYLISDNEG